MNNNFSFPVLEHPAPACDVNKALDLAKNWTELDQNAIATPLVSERDRNFLITNNEEKSVLKISNAKEDYGKLLTLDMSNGFATTDGLFIYLIVKNMDTGQDLVIQFPIGYWIIDKIDKKIPKQEKQKEEFDLDEYLKKNKGKGRLINLNITKVGD